MESLNGGVGDVGVTSSSQVSISLFIQCSNYQRITLIWKEFKPDVTPECCSIASTPVEFRVGALEGSMIKSSVSIKKRFESNQRQKNLRGSIEHI
jgi:hypothetical protein